MTSNRRSTIHLLNLTSNNFRRSLTPEASRNIFQSPTSKRSSSGRKSIGPGGSSNKPSDKNSSADPRGLKDKKVQNEVLASIIDILPQIDPTNHIDTSDLRKMSKQQFEDIIKTMLSEYPFFDKIPSGKLFSESLLNILLTINYPIKVAKSRLETPGVPHTIDTVLGILDFLKTLVTVDIRSREEFTHSNEDEEKDDALNREIQNGYIEYYTGKKTADEVINEICENVSQNNVEEQLANSRKDINSGNKQIKDNENGAASLKLRASKIKEENEGLRSENLKLQEEIEQAKLELQNVEKSINEEVKVGGKLDMERKIVNNTYIAVENKLAKLGINKEEALKDLIELKNKNDEIAIIEEEIQKYTIKKNDCANRKEGLFNSLRESVNRYNSLCEEGELVPETARYAFNINYKAALNEGSLVDSYTKIGAQKTLSTNLVEKFLGVEMKQSVKWGLRNTMEQVKEELEENQKNCVKVEVEINTLDIVKKQKAIEKEMLAKKVEDFRDFVNKSRNDWEDKTGNAQLEFTKNMYALEKSVKEKMDIEESLKRKLRAIEQDYKELESSNDVRRKTLEDEHIQYIKKLFIHKYKSSRIIEKAKESMEDNLAEVKYGN
eukprot:GAHX01002076.1.p1 GENE.GAHX01002076.1~~GAHX01002076.1.p1  ORF type:complete len:609 (+),score=162.21 GAHX01002076.1:3-1829(+)